MRVCRSEEERLELGLRTALNILSHLTLATSESVADSANAMASHVP